MKGGLARRSADLFAERGEDDREREERDGDSGEDQVARHGRKFGERQGR